MSKQQLQVEWSEEQSADEAKAYLEFRAKYLYFRPRNISGEDFMVDLLVAASNQFHMLDDIQETLKGRFSRVEWSAIELALSGVTEDKSAGPTVVEGIAGDFERNFEIRKLPVNLNKLRKKLESLSNMQRDALVDAGRKLRAYPGASLLEVLGHPDCSAINDEIFRQ